jgi:hypothetical protein
VRPSMTDQHARCPSLLPLLVGLAVLTVTPPIVAAQDLQIVGPLRSSGPATGPTSAKIVSPLRALIADFRSLGITPRNAAAMGAAERFSSEGQRVDGAGRVHDVTVADTTDATLTLLRRHGMDIEIINTDFQVVEGWLPVANLGLMASSSPTCACGRPSTITGRRT